MKKAVSAYVSYGLTSCLDISTCSCSTADKHTPLPSIDNALACMQVLVDSATLILLVVIFDEELICVFALLLVLVLLEVVTEGETLRLPL